MEGRPDRDARTLSETSLAGKPGGSPADDTGKTAWYISEDTRGAQLMARSDIEAQPGPSSQRLRLQTLVRLRWVAVAGQSITVLIVAFWLQFPLPLLTCALLIGALAAANFWLAVVFPPTHRLEPLAAFAVLGLDLLQLGALLFITGGLSNPFAPLICVTVIISFASQPPKHSLALMVLAMLSITMLAFSPYPLPWYPGEVLKTQMVMQIGVWSRRSPRSMAFAAFYVYRVSQEASLLADALYGHRARPPKGKATCLNSMDWLQPQHTSSGRHLQPSALLRRKWNVNWARTSASARTSNCFEARASVAAIFYGG